MSRLNYRQLKRRRADACMSIDELLQPVEPSPVPPLLAQACAEVEAHPEVEYWTEGKTVVVGHLYLYRVYRPSIISAGTVDMLCLRNPLAEGVRSFQVAYRSVDCFKSMADVAGFNAWPGKEE